MSTVFLRVLDASVDDKPDALLQAVASFHDVGTRSETLQRIVFELEPAKFSAVLRSPFAYWISDATRAVFKQLERLETGGRVVKQGLATRDDFRLARAWWEVTTSNPKRDAKWPLFAKGGSFSSYYSDVPLVVRWDGEAQASYLERTSNFNVLLTSSRDDFVYRPGLTWPLRTQIGFGMRAMPADCIFGHKGPAAFVDGDSPDQLLGLLAITTSAAFCYLVELQMAFGSYEVGVIQRTPVPELTDADLPGLASLARRAWSLKRSLDTTNETSHAFVLPPGLNERVTGLARGAVERELGAIQEEIDEAAFRLYGIGPEDRAAIEESTAKAPRRQESEEAGDEDDEGDDGSKSNGASLASSRLTGSPESRFSPLITSWLVGVAFGRFDPRLATGERAVPPEPEPFDALPSRSPGMWPHGEAIPKSWRLGALAVSPEMAFPDVLVNDEGHPDDLAGRVCTIAERVQVAMPEDLRGWLAKELFPLHIKMYSKSRRKAPIYWQLATASGSYSVWLYIHAFSKDTLFRIQNDYVAPKLAHEERRLDILRAENQAPRRGDAKTENSKSWRLGALTVSSQEALVQELRIFLEEVKRVAPLWNPDLDDGVIINFAPLWRLVPQNKAWQKQLRATWDELCAGKYDWAHLAMHLWPERVVPKCAKDRSLAIAHGLEDVFWAEGSDGKWTARSTPTRPIDELVTERTSPAVKSSLQSLLDAPVATGSAGRGRGGRRRAQPAQRRGGR